MSHFLDRLLFFKKNVDTFSGDHGVVTQEDRSWEDGYRKRWDFDKIVRSTHGVNCTGSCSWKIHVKSGIVVFETQQTDYPRTRPDMPNHEPRGCARGASSSWYLYHSGRVKYPMVRRALLELWREARKSASPVAAWKQIAGNPAYVRSRGTGGFVRSSWDEVNELIAAANVHTIAEHGPDRVVGFAPIPAYSMVSFSAGSRYLSLIGGVCLSFYDWYCDLPPSSPQTWGEQTDVPESADWYNAGFLMLWGSNVPQTRTPDAHFYTEVRYRGAKSVVVSPDYAEATKFADLWLHPKQGTDAALALALGHVILKQYHVDNPSPYFLDYCRRYSDMPFLVRVRQDGGRYVPERLMRAVDFADHLDQKNNPEWKPVAIDEKSGRVVVPTGSIGFRWGEKGKWNLDERDAGGQEVRLRLSLVGAEDRILPVAFPYFGAQLHPHFAGSEHPEVLERNVPVREVELGGEKALVATVYDLLLANYGIDRGLGGVHVAESFDDDVPYTPAWQEAITGVPRQNVISTAREFAENANKTEGRSMVILGAGLNHWYHMDMVYRGIINLLVMCGCIGKSGGGWAHYVGQEKIRPLPAWQTLAFALDWSRPPRHMAGTSFFYAHTDQWRYEKVSPRELLSPLSDGGDWDGSMIDLNCRAERMGWTPSAPQLEDNPLELARAAAAAGQSADAYVTDGIAAGRIRMSCEDPDNPKNFPRNLFVWRSNLLGASAKGHEYFLRHLVGAENHGVQGEELDAASGLRPKEVRWRDPAPEGKLDLLVTIDFRMSSTCLYSDVVLPTATWYEKNDIASTDMHPFMHPLCEAVTPAWEARSDWDIFKGLARSFDRVAEGTIGIEKDVVLVPIQHDTADELAQPLGVQEWRKGECEAIPGKTMPKAVVVERDYTNVYRKFTALGPLIEKLGMATKGVGWEAGAELETLAALNGVVDEAGVSQGLVRIETDIQAAETILTLAPETNGAAAVKAWDALSEKTGRPHRHLAEKRAAEKLRFQDLVAQPRKIISSPSWSGIESDQISYNANYVNVHEGVPWRTLTGRQQVYQDHPWMRAFGEAFAVYRPPLDTRSISGLSVTDNGHPELVLNFLTPHQKWGIHSSFTDNLLMLTLSRGGPIAWLNEEEARGAGIRDNDWIEAYTVDGALTARAVVSQRIRAGTCMMYHAQDKTINTPGAETNRRRGIHNSVTRIVPKPTHMIGGYAHLSWALNYYGTVGANRDTFVVVRKMKQVDWLDGSQPRIVD
jgi:nitrate reductase alpha subunit